MASLLQLGSRDYLTAGDQLDRFSRHRPLPDVTAILRALEVDRVREVVGLSLGKAHCVAETDGAERAVPCRCGRSRRVRARMKHLSRQACGLVEALEIHSPSIVDVKGEGTIQTGNSRAQWRFRRQQHSSS